MWGKIVFKVKFDKSVNKLEIFNASKYPNEINAPIKIPIKPKQYDKILKKLGLNILQPINEGEDFIYTYLGNSMINDSLYHLEDSNIDNLLGRSFGDIYPYFKEYIYPIFKEVYKNDEEKIVMIHIHEDNSLKNIFELRILLNDDEEEIYLLIKDQSEMYKLKNLTKNKFELSPYPMSVVQNGHIVKINKAYEDLTGISIEEANKLTKHDFNKNKIIYNDTGLVLNYSQIIDKILAKEYHQIIYNILIENNGQPKILECRATPINFKGENAVKFQFIREINEFDIKLNEFTHGKVDLIQKIAKTAFIFYDVENNQTTWSKSLEFLLEGSLSGSGDIRNIFYEAITKDDTGSFAEMYNNATKDSDYIEGDLKFKTLKNNIKYVHYSLKPLFKDGEIVRWLQILTDITDEHMNMQKLTNLNVTVKDMQEAAHISVYYRLSNGEHVWTPETYDLIEREPRDDDKYKHIIVDLASPNDQHKFYSKVDKLKPNEFLGAHRMPITLENGKVKYLQLDTRKFYDEDGKFIQESCYAMDITEEWNWQNTLIKSNAEKTVLIKEVHHRVKNNLQTITSLISLEERFKTDPAKILDITKTRINALALIHETIYNEFDMNYISIKNFFSSFDDKLKLLSSHPDIVFNEDIEDLTLYIDTATPLVLMINELTTNSFKHAFEKEDENKEIYKSLKSYEENGVKMCKFHYKDNGKGLPEDIDSIGSLGWIIVKSLITQVDGKYEIFNDNGFNFVLKFPYIENIEEEL